MTTTDVNCAVELPLQRFIALHQSAPGKSPEWYGNGTANRRNGYDGYMPSWVAVAVGPCSVIEQRTVLEVTRLCMDARNACSALYADGAAR